MKFNCLLEASIIEGFRWSIQEYQLGNEIINVEFTEHEYNTLIARYKDLYHASDSDEELVVPFDLKGYINGKTYKAGVWKLV